MRSISANYPEVPLLYSIPGDLQHNSKIEIIGQMLHRNRFRVDLKTGSKVPVGIHDDTNDDVIFHLSIRPFCNEIVRNHMTQGRWGHEEREGGCPIQYGSQFNMLILIEDDKFKVTINNLQFCEFKHRLRLSLAKFLYISGEVKIHFIKIRNDSYDDTRSARTI
ncbi:galectin-7-like [Contarinia nasturtii]|uniref:galectin-7-like n=1 Tax=Contarinia nasturtii TaxID=265458 RepID=UPI0012D45E0F|nr:galectin-7-like [Contarinia nasturtii]